MRAWEMISDPFYDRGPNDKGIGVQLAYSLGRLLVGYSAAVVVAVSLGVLLGFPRRSTARSIRIFKS